jgi:hypothetical protein
VRCRYRRNLSCGAVCILTLTPVTLRTKKIGKPFSYSWSQREEVIALRQQGLMLREIARRTGLTRGAIAGPSGASSTAAALRLSRFSVKPAAKSKGAGIS